MFSIKSSSFLSVAGTRYTFVWPINIYHSNHLANLAVRAKYDQGNQFKSSLTTHHSWTLRATSVPWTLPQSLWQKMSHVSSVLVSSRFPFSHLNCPLHSSSLQIHPFVLPPFQHLQSFGFITGSFLLPEICQVLHEQMPSCISRIMIWMVRPHRKDLI